MLGRGLQGPAAPQTPRLNLGGSRPPNPPGGGAAAPQNVRGEVRVGATPRAHVHVQNPWSIAYLQSLRHLKFKFCFLDQDMATK